LLAEDADLRRVDRDEHRRDPDDPRPRRHVWKPEGEVDRDRRDLGADREDLHERIRRAHGEAGPRGEIAIGEDAEGAGHRMHDRHLGEREAHHRRDHRAERVGDEHAGTGEPDRDRASEEKADADRPAERHHRDLARHEPAPQAFVGRGDRLRHGDPILARVAPPPPRRAP